MKRFGTIAAAVIFSGAAAFAQTPAAPTGVGLINFQRAIEQNDEGVKAAGVYRQEVEKLKSKLDVSQKEITDLQKKLDDSAKTLTDSEKNSALREIDKKQKVFDVDRQDAQNTADDKQDELFRPVADRVKKVVEAYAKELNLAVVVNISEDMIYANDVVDISTEIIRRVNADIAKNPAKPK
jgi:Skp family chaperone for outer membrane proteins